jgi:hypothetical protein
VTPPTFTPDEKVWSSEYVLASESRVDEANVQVEVEKVYASPAEFKARPPEPMPETVRFARLALEVAVSVPTVARPIVDEEIKASGKARRLDVAWTRAPQEVEGVKGYEAVIWEGVA